MTEILNSCYKTKKITEKGNFGVLSLGLNWDFKAACQSGLKVYKMVQNSHFCPSKMELVYPSNYENDRS